MVACICHSPLHHQKPDFEGQSVIKASCYLLPFVLEAHRESLPRSCETSARRLSAESAEVYSTADLSASAAHIPFSHRCPPIIPVEGALRMLQTHATPRTLPFVLIQSISFCARSIPPMILFPPSPHLVNIGESALSLHTPLCSDVVTWAVVTCFERAQNEMD